MQNRDIDLIIYDKRGQPVLLVLVKGLVGKSAQWAAEYRRNLLSHETLPRTPYFLIATPDRLYFWKQDYPSSFEELPTFIMDAVEEFKPYLEGLNQGTSGIGGEALEWVLVSWLNNLQSKITPRLKQEPALHWLVESGLLDALEGSRLQMTAA